MPMTAMPSGALDVSLIIAGGSQQFWCLALLTAFLLLLRQCLPRLRARPALLARWRWRLLLANVTGQCADSRILHERRGREISSKQILEAAPNLDQQQGVGAGVGE